MTTIDTLRSLQQRIREATGPDRELDCLIQAVFDGRTVREDGNNILARSTRPPYDECLIGRIDPGKRQRNFTEAWRNPPVPNYTTDPDGLGACVALCREVLPGYAWKVGTCCVSDDAWVVPDFNCQVHGPRLREKFGEIEWGSIWDTGIDIDRRPSGNACLAFLDAIVSAKIAELEAKEKADV